MTALTFLDTETRTGLQSVMESHYGEMTRLEAAIAEMKAVQKFAPMFSSTLSTLEQLRERSAVAFSMARRDYIEAAILPLLEVAVPNARYTALYAMMKAWRPSPYETSRYAREIKALDATKDLAIESPHLITRVATSWVSGGEHVVKSFETVYDEVPRNLTKMEEWLRQEIQSAAIRKQASKERSRARNERKKKYDAWRRERKAATGEELPNFGKAAAEHFLLNVGSKWSEKPNPDVVQPPEDVPFR